MARVSFRLQYNVFHLHLKWQLICADCIEKLTFISSKYEDYFLKWSKSIKMDGKNVLTLQNLAPRMCFTDQNN